eukprot:15485625-Alexandrium_andersonii.AAC.1
MVRIPTPGTENNGFRCLAREAIDDLQKSTSHGTARASNSPMSGKPSEGSRRSPASSPREAQLRIMALPFAPLRRWSYRSRDATRSRSVVVAIRTVTSQRRQARS